MNDTPPPAATPSAEPGLHALGRIAVIAAVARNGVIGVDNRLPWRIPEDLKRFRALTMGHSIIMGRRTWESLSGSLPGRQNIVVTRQAGFRAAGAQTASSPQHALELATRPEPIFVIGGEELYRAVLPLADILYLTEIDRDFPGDARFPPFDRAAFREASRDARHGDGPDGFNYAFTAYVRRRERA